MFGLKRRNTEINIFSMSALDLFASALGAFILLAVVFLPFFPNTGDHPKVSEAFVEQLEAAKAAVTKLTADLAQREQEKTALEVEKAQLEKELEEAAASTKFPALDIVMALDTTGSMGDQIASLKREVSQFAELMQQLSPDFAMGIVDFKDRCDSQTLRIFNLTKINSSSLVQLQNFADAATTESNCNRDAPEALKAGLEAAVDMPWRSAATVHLIIVVTDDRTYPEEEELAVSLANSFSSRGPGYTVSVAEADKDNKAPEVGAFLQRLADAGDGDLISGNGTFTSTILLALAGV